MSSNIEVQRICQHCGKVFIAKTTTTKYCSHRCNRAAYKVNIRKDKVEKANKATIQIKSQNIDYLRTKEFFTVGDVASLLGCSLRTIYRLIDNGTLKAVNLGERMTRIKRSDLYEVMEQPRLESSIQEVTKKFEIEDYYTLMEVRGKYGISEAALYGIIKRNNISKIRKGRFAYVSKSIIDSLLR